MKTSYYHYYAAKVSFLPSYRTALESAETVNNRQNNPLQGLLRLPILIANSRTFMASTNLAYNY